MAVCLNDQLKFSGIIEKLNQNGRKYFHSQESKNLLVINEEQMFIWHDSGSCVVTVEIKTDKNYRPQFKMLLPTSPPMFQVDCLQFNRIGSLLALVGRKGIMILEVPWRYGKFWTTSDSCFCRSWHIAERFFICSSRVSILHVAWHPGSSTSTHLIVLSSDNYLRLYDVIDFQVPVWAVQLGSSSSNSFLSASAKISFSSCFGETAVCFDFGLPEALSKSNRSRELSAQHSSNEIWPIFILFGNGDVFLVRMDLQKTNFQVPKIEGPLVLYPPAEDNYGVDACYILCLHSVPPVLVIATASGMLYHCFLLESGVSSLENAKLSFESSMNETDIALYVYESVELPLSLTSEETDDAFCQFIRLYKDLGSDSRYHCTHVMGVHSVEVPVIQLLEDCSEKDFQTLLYLMESNHCVVEHLLCTRPLTVDEAVPVIGLGMTVGDKGMIMICLLASWEFTCLSLVSSRTLAPHLLSTNLNLSESDSKIMQSESLEQHIRHLLLRSTSTPILKSSSSLSNSQNNPHQWLELLTNMTRRFREEYLQSLNAAQTQLETRIKVLRQYKDQQILEVNRLVAEKENLCKGAESLAEKYEDALSKLQVLENRIEHILQLLQKRMPVLSNAESTMKQNLQSKEEILKSLKQSLALIKERISYQKEKEKSRNETNEHAKKNSEGNPNLNETQQKHVKEILMQEGKSITELIKTVESLKIDVGL